MKVLPKYKVQSLWDNIKHHTGESSFYSDKILSSIDEIEPIKILIAKHYLCTQRVETCN